MIANQTEPEKDSPVKDESEKDFSPQEGGNFPPRQMVQGHWTCSDCGKEITELPFEPAPDRPIYCRDCWMKRRDQRRDRGPRFRR